MAQVARAAAGAASVGYDVAARPAEGKSLYRDGGAALRPQNIMYDRRVVRGSTYAMPVVSQAAAAEAQKRAKEEEFRRLKTLETQRLRAEAAGRVSTPPAVAGRRHADVNTEEFLEVLSDRAPEEEAGVQTEAQMDRPPTPVFVPQPSGVDATTQIEAGELFDFDFEVSPLLDVLVGKTLEQALAEVVQEDELAAIRAKQAEYEAVRAAELAEVQRLEAEVKRRFAEKQRRMDQEKSRLEREAAVREKVAAGAFARSYLSSLRRNIFTHLHESGHFYDPVKREMESQVMPGVLAAVAARLTARQGVASSVADDLIQSALSLGAQKYSDYLAGLEAAAAAAKKKAEDEAAAAAAAVAAAAAAAAAAEAEAAAKAAAVDGAAGVDESAA